MKDGDRLTERLNVLIRAFLAALGLLFLAACQNGAGGEDIASASQESVEVAPLTIPDDADPALWVVKDSDTSIYLFGTIHFLPDGVTWFDEAVREAFDASQETWVEMVAPSAAEMAQTTIQVALAEDGVTLRSRLQPDQTEKLVDRLDNEGLPPDFFDPFDPWYAYYTLYVMDLVNNGFDPMMGADYNIEAASKTGNKPVKGLETFEQQLGIFEALPLETQLQLLDDFLNAGEMTESDMNKLVATWAHGDVEQVAVLLNEGMADPVVYDILLTKRNKDWAKQIKARMKKPGTVFIAVGAGHLAGEESVQKHLAAQNLKVERIEY